MTSRPGGTVTRLLAGWRDGTTEADERLAAAVYAELRRLASAYMRRERPGQTLEPTALVHEAYLRLRSQRQLRWANRGHFYGIAARMMRRVLVDHARRRRALKRGDAEHITASNVADPHGGGEAAVLAVHEALDGLAVLDRRQAEIVELRFFGGLTVEEIGETLDLSPSTVKRELATARLWLRHQLRRVGASDP